MATIGSPQSSNQRKSSSPGRADTGAVSGLQSAKHPCISRIVLAANNPASVSSRPHLILVHIQGAHMKYSLAGDRVQLAGTLCTASMQASADCAAGCHNLADMKVTPPLHQPPRSQRFCASTKVFASRPFTLEAQVHICNRFPDKLKHCPHYKHKQLQVRGSSASKGASARQPGSLPRRPEELKRVMQPYMYSDMYAL